MAKWDFMGLGPGQLTGNGFIFSVSWRDFGVDCACAERHFWSFVIVTFKRSSPIIVVEIGKNLVKFRSFM